MPTDKYNVELTYEEVFLIVDMWFSIYQNEMTPSTKSLDLLVKLSNQIGYDYQKEYGHILK